MLDNAKNNTKAPQVAKVSRGNSIAETLELVPTCSESRAPNPLYFVGGSLKRGDPGMQHRLLPSTPRNFGRLGEGRPFNDRALQQGSSS
jgi:hypothetical protein